MSLCDEWKRKFRYGTRGGQDKMVISFNDLTLEAT